MKKARALWELMRLEHGLMLIVAIFIGALIAGRGLPPADKTLFAFLTALFLQAATFALNDYYDLEVDRLNRRMDRPLVRGDLSPKAALGVYFLLLPAGIITGALVNTTCLIIALLNALLASLYDVKLKEFKIVGNFYIAFAMAIPFLFGATAVSREIPPVIYLLAAVAFLAGAGREIMKDVQDVEGDKARGTRSFPTYLGSRGACALAALFYLIAVFLSIIPFIHQVDEDYYRDPFYLVAVLVTDAVLIYVAGKLLQKPLSVGLERYRKVTLAALGMGLLAFLIGAFF